MDVYGWNGLALLAVYGVGVGASAYLGFMDSKDLMRTFVRTRNPAVLRDMYETPEIWGHALGWPLLVLVIAGYFGVFVPLEHVWHWMKGTPKLL